MTAERRQTPTFEELYKAAKALQQKKAARELKHQEEVYAKEREEAPFEPDLVHKSHDKQLKMIVSLSRQPKHDYGPLKKGETTYSDRFARIQEFKAQDTYHPLDRSGYQPFRQNRPVGEGLHAPGSAFDQQDIDGETQEHMSQLAETMLDEEHNMLLSSSFPH